MKQIYSLIALAALALVLLSCVDVSVKESGSPQSSSTGGGETSPGIDFAKRTVGLPSKTMDFIGTRSISLAGAKDSGDVFFGVIEGDHTTIYRRNLGSFARSEIANVSNILAGSLSVTPDGKRIVFSRMRRTDRYIDDPAMQYPAFVSIPTEIEVSSGDQVDLYDFTDPEWTRYRNDQLIPFVSPDGQRVVTISYDIERLAALDQVGRWLQLDADVLAGGDALADWNLEDPVASLRNLMHSRIFSQLIEAKGIEPLDEGPITEEERGAMIDIEAELIDLKAALLVNEGGEERILPLVFHEDYREGYLHSILTVSNSYVLLYAQRMNAVMVEPNVLFKADLQSGELSLVGQFTGSASTIEIDRDEKDLMVVYNPVDLEMKQILNQTNILRIPLSGGEPTETVLPGDYIAYVDISRDGKWFAGQDSQSNDLYLVDVENLTAHRQVGLLGQISGIFMANSGENLVYFENGILFAVESSKEAEGSIEWVSADSFSQYEPDITSFASTAGYILPDDLEFEWEDKEGLGQHELGVWVSSPSSPDVVMLARYSFDEEKVMSVWFPLEKTFPRKDAAGEKVDFYGARQIAEGIVKSTGWLDEGEWELYHPGPNPLYDGRSQSFILVFRDGYWFGEGDDAKWVVNREATIRIKDTDGSVPEMSLASYPEIASQPMTATMSQVTMSIRNQPQMPIPEEAPIRFDTEGLRYIIAPLNEDRFGPASYPMRVGQRICYEVDAYIQPEDELMMTTLVDTETAEVLGQIDYLPTQGNAGASGASGM